MALIKFLLLLLAPPVLNWLVGRFWETYRELRLHRFVFWAWVTAAAPAVILIVTGVAQAVDQGIQIANERTDGGEVRPATFDWGNGTDNFPLLTGLETAVSFTTDETAYGPMITQAAQRHGLDPMLFTAQIKHESSFNPDATGKAGEHGFGQIMPIIRNWCGLSSGYDPYDNLDCSASFMAYLMDKYGSATLALAAYNAGEPAVDACHCVPDGKASGYVKAINAYYNEYLSTAVSSKPLTMGMAVSLLYVGSEPVMSQGWHPSVGLPDAQDWTAGCRKPLSSPVPGVATVTYNGDDGLGIGNTMITIEGPGGKVTLLHGDYSAPVGSTVVGGVTRIGIEASNGNSTGCHSHVILYED